MYVVEQGGLFRTSLVPEIKVLLIFSIDYVT